ncbi:MAG: hypothetical protein JXO50_11130 [Deltaproteobacteria bacterium]|nr:hypothetical protein [Candidatus Anaeroferrophillus wilburensis]
MTIIAQRLDRISLGATQHFKNLTMFPLVDDQPHAAEYLLLEEALEAGYARVTEISESGSVPELRFVNDAEKPVLLLDGEELIGAKQNRIVNLTILVPAKTTITIPVSCVESGRWQAKSAAFSAAKRTHFATGRARKASRVSESMNRFGSRQTNQGEVWEDIEVKFCGMKASSPTMAAAAMYEDNRESLDNYQKAFAPVDNQTGALFAISGKAIGLDLFDSTEPLQAMLPSLVQSYALDAIDNLNETSATDKAAEPQVAEQLLVGFAQAITNRFPAIGEGQDIRLQGNAITGGALAVGKRVVHLCAFQLGGEERSSHHRGGRMAKASVRRGQRID